MNIRLSTLGWVTDAPPGNRLRWDYPLQALDANGQYLGLPKTLILASRLRLSRLVKS